MGSRYKKIQTAVFVGALVLLAAVWAVNGYENTWLFVTMAIVVVPNAWWVELVNKLRKKNNDQ